MSHAAPRPFVVPRLERGLAVAMVALALLGARLLVDDLQAMTQRQQQRRAQLTALRQLRDRDTPAPGPVAGLDGLFLAHRVVVSATPAGNLVTVVPNGNGARP